MTTLRAYAPLTLPQLAAAWPDPQIPLAYAPDAAGRALSGDDLEEAEWLALSAAAEHAAREAAAGGRLRAVLAVDVTGAQETALGAGLVAVAPAEASEIAIVSAHLDEPGLAARLGRGQEADAQALSEAALLWYDPSELRDVLDGLPQDLLD
ncbi:hypothetical protein BRM1_00280 [Brevibacterium sp. BRM-1]|uniref:DUF6912 family protein n=1 Tax=Brevibacterium sp. BRM-1 TaxID=2999062 RepID=UPI002280A84C|nr:hypothetical protein [Brevibacterium sp. BRM-1]WAL40352.1 hypothetical protein BRM1_00280 [Brevibacterium sp. BRM-1]